MELSKKQEFNEFEALEKLLAELGAEATAQVVEIDFTQPTADSQAQQAA